MMTLILFAAFSSSNFLSFVKIRNQLTGNFIEIVVSLKFETRDLIKELGILPSHTFICNSGRSLKNDSGFF
jgi:hypothetical protein